MSLGLASASTLVTGVVYNSDFSDVVSDASVVVNCDTLSISTDSGNGTFNQDGIYAVIFSSDCNDVSVSASKDGLSGSSSAIVGECNQGNCSTEYIAVGNPSISAPVNNNNGGSGGGSSGGSGVSSGGTGGSTVPFYLCGNGVCDTGETVTSCPQDCVVESTNETTTQEDTNSNGRRGITGAVIGAVTSTGGIIIIVVIVLLGVSSGIYFSKKRKLAKVDAD